MNGGAGMNWRQANIGGRHEWEAGKYWRQARMGGRQEWEAGMNGRQKNRGRPCKLISRGGKKQVMLTLL